ncbi:MAG: Gfo/Idh/MocA family oxidoreductase [Anaerolineales bacterium]|nr:Gfo/Idh/MocA family oxidoreductase [Anaerolineales bacterium]
MTDKLNIGIIGLGGIANLHHSGWERVENARVVAGSDINPAMLERWQTEYGVANLTTEPSELIDDPDIDVIDICTPNRFHTDFTVAALEAGKHVLCEKPLAPTVAEIEKMIAARDRSGKLLMTGQHFRFTGAAQAIKQEIAKGALGDIYHARAWWLRRSGVPTRPTFIYKDISAGGVNLDLGVHVLDLAMWFMGNPQPVAVSGVTRTELAKQDGAFSVWGGDIPADIDVDEFSAGFIRFENGATLVLEVSWMLHHNPPEDYQTWLYGTNGGAHWPSAGLYQTDNQVKQHYDVSLKLTEDKIRPHHQEIEAFAQAIRNGGTSPVPAEQSLQVTKVLQALYESSCTGHEVVIA